jgi:hypothetical protein
MTDTPIQRAYEELSRLTQETTELLEQCLLIKSRLNTSVERSETAANNAQSSEDDTRKLLQQVQTLKQTIDAKYTDVVKLLNDAEAVVFGGGYSVTPTPGNVPIADANGKLDEGWLPEDWSQLEAVLALAIDNVTENLQRYKAELEAQNHLAVLDEQVDSLLKRLILLRKDFSNTEHNLGVVQQDLENIALVSADQEEYFAEVLRSMGQSGFLLGRQYTYGGQFAFNRPFTNNYSALGIHDHSDFGEERMLLGMAEGKAIVDGKPIGRRHTDYEPRMPAPVGSNWLATQPVQTPDVPPDVLAQPTVELQIAKMREYFEVAVGKRPASDVADFANAFKVCIAYEEMWDEVLTQNIVDTFTSGRHKINASTMTELLNHVRYYNEGGHKDRLENIAYWHAFVKRVDAKGKSHIAVRKSRVCLMPVGNLVDYPLATTLESVDDILMRQRLGLSQSQLEQTAHARFRIKSRVADSNGNIYQPDLIDEMFSKICGLDGDGAYLTEQYDQYGLQDRLTEFSSAKPLNAAYYNRFYSAQYLDASNRSGAKRGYNDPTLWVAKTTRPEVSPVIVGTEELRFTKMIPLEVVILTPLHKWRARPINKASTYSTSKGYAENNPLEGYHPTLNFYCTPIELYESGTKSAADAADTAANYRWVRCADGIARKHTTSGVPIILPHIPNVGAFRVRYPIPFSFYEGSYAQATSEAMQREQCSWNALAINQVTESLKHEKRLLDLEKTIGA